MSRSHKAALIYDGVHLFSRAVENLIQETDLKTPQVGCDNKEVPYDMGNRLLQEINKVSCSGADYIIIKKWEILFQQERKSLSFSNNIVLIHQKYGKIFLVLRCL